MNPRIIRLLIFIAAPFLLIQSVRWMHSPAQASSPNVTPPQTASSCAILEYRFNETGTDAASTGTDSTPVIFKNSAGNITDLHGGPGSGVSGQSSDIAFDNTASAEASLGGRAEQPFDDNNVDSFTSFTLQGWIKTDDPVSETGNAGRLFDKNDTDGGYFVAWLDGKFQYQVKGPGGVGHMFSQSWYQSQNQWIFFAITYDSTASSDNIKFYKGTYTEAVALKEVATMNVGAVNESTGTMSLGNASHPIRAFKGLLDNMRVFGSKTDGAGVLTQSQLETLRLADLQNTAPQLACQTPTPTPTPCTTPPSGMVSWWKGEGNTDDALGNSSGTAQGGVSYSTGKVGQAFSLNGIDAYVNAGNAPGLQVSDGDFTVDVWVKFNALSHPPGANNGAPEGDMSIMDKMSTSGVNADGWRLLKQHDNRFWFCFGAGFSQCGVPTYTIFSQTQAITGQWYHVAVVKTASSFSIYVNGVLEDTRPLPSFVDSNSGNLLIGANALEWSRLNGLIDEAKVYNRALSGAEIQSVFNAGSAGNCAPSATPTPTPTVDPNCVAPTGGMLGWWAGDGNASDLVGNNTGTVQGASFAFPAAKVNQGFGFSQNNLSNRDRVTIPHRPEYNIQSTGFTADFWMKGDRFNQPFSDVTIFEKSHGPNSAGWTFQGSANPADPNFGRVFFNIGDGIGFPGVGSDGIVLDGQWHHIVGTWDGTTIRLYIDGVLQSSTAPLTAPMPNNGTVNIGYWAHGDRDFRGMVDEPAIFSRALSGAEIQSIFNAGSAGRCKNAGDINPPETFILAGPAEGSVVGSGNSTFSFTGTDDVTIDHLVTYECSLDGAPFSLCSSPVNYPALSDGVHTFAVRAVDGAGNKDQTPASVTWMVATAPPEPTPTPTPTPVGNTPTGTNVSVSLATVTVTFSNVSAAGETTATPMDPLAAGTLPGGFALSQPPVAFDISTTATYSGPIQVCFNVQTINDPVAFANLRIFHGEGGLLVDRTSSTNFASRTVCATVNSLSPFVLATTLPAYSICPLYDESKAYKSGSTVPIKLKLCDGAGNNLSSGSIYVRAIGVMKISDEAFGAVENSGSANSDFNFRYDAQLGGAGGGYIFNLSTKGISTGTYLLGFKVGNDPNIYTLKFKVK